MNIKDWLNRTWTAAVIDTLLGRDGGYPPGQGGKVGEWEVPNFRVYADIPPVAQKGSYALYPGINVTIDPAPGRKIVEEVAKQWLYFQVRYYEDNVVSGDLETSSGATRGQFHMNNVVVRDDGFSFSFPFDDHPAGMPYAQLATFIEVTKGVPIIEVDTNRLAAITREEWEMEYTM